MTLWRWIRRVVFGHIDRVVPRGAIAVPRAVFCGNGDHIYDGYEWECCPTCGSDGASWVIPTFPKRSERAP